MADGRQRKAEALRRMREEELRRNTDSMGNPLLDQNFAGMNTNDGADQRSRLLNTQAGFNINDLTSLVSDDDNDLEDISFKTKDGAQVSMKNARGKDANGQEITPTVKTLGKSYSGGATQANYDMLGKPLGTSYSGGSTFTGYPTPDPELPPKQAKALTDFIGEDLSLPTGDTDFAGQGMSTDDFGNVYDQQLNADMLSEQMNRNAFSPEDNQVDMPDSIGTSYSGGATQDPAMLDLMRNGIGQSYSGGPTQTPQVNMPDSLGTSYSGGATQDPMMLELMRNGIGKSYSGGATQTPVINEQVVNNAPVQSYTVQEGSPEDLDLQNNPEVIGETLNDNGTVTYQLQNKDNTTQQVATPAPGMYDNVAPGNEVALTTQDPYANTAPNLSNPTDIETMQLEADYAARTAENQKLSDMTNESVAFKKEQGIDPFATLDPTVDPGRSEELPPMVNEPTIEEKAKAAGAMYADGTIDQDFLDAQAQDAYTGSVAEDSRSPEQVATDDAAVKGDIAIAAKGNPQVEAVANEAKTEVDKVIEQVNNNEITEETAMEKIQGFFGNLGDLFGIDGKDVTRALFRYAGSRLAGYGGGAAANFAYKGFETDNSGATLGKNATSAERNLHNYNKVANKNLKEAKTSIDKNDKIIDAQFAKGKIDATEVETQKTAFRDKTSKEVDAKNIRHKRNLKMIPEANKFASGMMIDPKTGLKEQVQLVHDRTTGELMMKHPESGDLVTPDSLGYQDARLTNKSETAPVYAMDTREDTGNNASGKPFVKKIPHANGMSSGGMPTFDMEVTQAKNHTFATRGIAAYENIEILMSDPKTADDLLSFKTQFVESWDNNAEDSSIFREMVKKKAYTPEAKMFFQYIGDLTSSRLRLDTGAAYSAREMKDTINKYFKYSSNDEETKAMKLGFMRSEVLNFASGLPSELYLRGTLNGDYRRDDAREATIQRTKDMVYGDGTKKDSTKKDSTKKESSFTPNKSSKYFKKSAKDYLNQ